jgi:hypothetical protein
MSKKKELTKPIPVRRSPAERKVIQKLASDARLSEARLMVTAALMMGDFRTAEELRAALHIGGQLWQTRTSAVMQVRRLGHQLERLRDEMDSEAGAAGLGMLDEALGEVAAFLKNMGASWNGRSQK